MPPLLARGYTCYNDGSATPKCRLYTTNTYTSTIMSTSTSKTPSSSSSSIPASGSNQDKPKVPKDPKDPDDDDDDESDDESNGSGSDFSGGGGNSTEENGGERVAASWNHPSVAGIVPLMIGWIGERAHHLNLTDIWCLRLIISFCAQSSSFVIKNRVWRCNVCL